MTTTHQQNTTPRHRRRRGRGTVIALTLTALVVTVAGAVTVAADTGDRSPHTPCQGRVLRVAAAPAIAPAVRSIAEQHPASRCLAVQVRVADPAVVRVQLEQGTVPAEVWIPDSSYWAQDSLRASVTELGSVARTPVVLAVPASAAARLGAPTYRAVGRAATTAHPLVLQAASPQASAPTAAVLAQLDSVLGRDPVGRGQLFALLRGMQTGPEPSTNRPIARATTEQAVVAANGAGEDYQPVYPPGPDVAMDFPYLVLASDRTRADEGPARPDAEALYEALTSIGGDAQVQTHGFRSPRTGTGLAEADGVDATVDRSWRPLAAADVETAARALATFSRESRLLALIDVSGSMAQPVPGDTGTTRIALVRTALRRALELFPAGTVAGLWRFSSELTPTTDYEQVSPMRRLTPAARARIGAAAARLRAVRGGGTSLYASILAAVRHVRGSYDPSRVNSVVVLSDGRNEYDGAHGIALETLLAALRSEADPERPVPVFSIAYGPDSDQAAMAAVSGVTGGALYPVRRPSDLPVIFRSAVGRRLCSPAC